MKHISAEHALSFVKALELPAPRGYDELLGDKTVKPVEYGFDTAKNQAMVVGSDIVSFVQGVTPERREDIVNSSLLAQLAAKKKVSDPTKIYDWYNAYFDVLTNIGWAVQDQGFAEYSESSAGFEAHEAILSVAAVLLGPGATTLAIIKATLDALKSMSTDSPWITLFNRESQSAHTARFQVTLAEQSSDDQFLVSLMAFGLEAKAALTQVLFFKFHSNEASLKHYSGKVTINAHVLASVRDAIKNKLAGFAKDYVEALPPL
ncbi:MAG: hypothetical protein ACM3ON_11030 [Chloroflexota bacterium]